ncbi:hypothetical protein GQ600_27829 [Phytophthora cactorum]|nr:hypothetical protein GQ600_27829 [Phytophthora cactorum]
MDNTKTEAVRGLLEWAGNGIHFRKTQLNRGKELVDENWQLETLYRDKVHVDRIAQVIQSKALLAFKDSVDELVPDLLPRVRRRRGATGRELEVMKVPRREKSGGRTIESYMHSQLETSRELYKCLRSLVHTPIGLSEANGRSGLDRSASMELLISSRQSRRGMV